MSGYDIILAKKFKERNNVKYEGPIIGTVVQGLPDLKVAIYKGEVILDLNNMYFTGHVLDHEHETTQSGTITIGGVASAFDSEGRSKFKENLEVKKQLLLIPDSDGQCFYVIDSVRKLR